MADVPDEFLDCFEHQLSTQFGSLDFPPHTGPNVVHSGRRYAIQAGEDGASRQEEDPLINGRK
jgi:hypothetical protein